MLLEYNKFNIILFFLTGTTVTFAIRQWIFGFMILCLSFFLLIQYNVVISGNEAILKYKHITQLPAVITSIILLVASLYILSESNAEGMQKLLSVFFVLGVFGFNLCKYFFGNNPLFKFQFSRYVSALLFMVVLLSVSIIPENQAILEKKYNKLRGKVEDKLD